MIVIYNPPAKVEAGKQNGSKIRDIFQKAVYEQDANSIKAYESNDLAHYLLKKFSFLKEISIDEVPKYEKMIEKYVEPSSVEQQQAQLTDKEKEILAKIGVSAPVGAIVGTGMKSRVLSPEEMEGIPESGKDQHGVEWYGEGEQRDSSGMTMGRVPGKQGVFGAA